MKGTERPEAHETLAMGTGEHVRASEFSIPDFRNEDLDSPPSMRCWQPGEVEVEDPWGIGSISSRSDGWVTHDRSEILKKSKSKQLHGSRRMHRAGRRVFSCFRHSTINFAVREMEPSTPPKSGPLLAPPKSGPLLARISVGGAHGGTFMDDAMDHHTDKNKDLNAEEPTSPVVNCMGQVRKSNKKKKYDPKKTEQPKAVNDLDKFRRTKSQAPRSSPPRVSRSISCKWKQLLRSNSSSISPSNHPLCDGEFEIDLCRFSSASGSSDPFYHDIATDRKPDKTRLFMRRSNSTSQTIPSKTDSDYTHDLCQEQLDARNHSVEERGEHRKTAMESELVFKNLPKLKTKNIEAPKWLADEPTLNRRHGLYKGSKMNLHSSSTPKGNS